MLPEIVGDLCVDSLQFFDFRFVQFSFRFESSQLASLTVDIVFDLVPFVFEIFRASDEFFEFDDAIRTETVEVDQGRHLTSKAFRVGPCQILQCEIVERSGIHHVLDLAEEHEHLQSIFVQLSILDSVERFMSSSIHHLCCCSRQTFEESYKDSMCDVTLRFLQIFR